MMFIRVARILIPAVLILAFSFSAFAQKPPTKKNARPGSGDAGKAKSDVQVSKGKLKFKYEFEKPEFLVSKILIVHDENGVGTAKFRKKNFEDDIEDPLRLSATTLERLKSLWDTVKFLDSTEKFQSDVRDYGHLGTMKLSMKDGERERTEVFNWTEDLDVRALAAEYRKIGNQAIWMFDFAVARQNQPLETPRIMIRLDSQLKRNAISDPQQMLPFLKALTDDERVPLIARNHASRLVKRIEKTAVLKKDSNGEENEKGNL